MAESSLGRNRVFQIKNDDGTPFHNLVLHKATYDSVVMSLVDKITGDVYYKDNKLDVTMNEYIEFARDPDDSSEEPVKFILVNPPTIVKEGIVSDNSELKGMTKYSFEFYHPMCKLGNMPLTDIAVTQDEERYLSQNKTFSWCGTGNDFIAKLNANLYYSEWIVVASENEQSAQRLAMMPSEVPTKKAGEQAKSNVLSFDKNTIADGLKTIYETWDIPFVVDALHQGEYYDADGKDYYSEEGGNKRFVVIVGMPSNEIIDTESEFGVVVNATQIANGDIYYGGQPISVQKGKKIVLQSLTDGAMPMILNSSHNGVIGTTSKTFETDMTIYVGLYPKSGYVKYFYDGDCDNVFVFRYGQGVGLKNNSRTPRNNKIITRISASGSEDNIPYGYPQIQWTGSEDDPRLKYPLYKGIVGGQYVTLIKHPFTRTRLMPSVYVESVNKKVNPNHPLYDPDTELVDYYDADSTYENPIITSSPSYEIHEFDGIKPELDSDRQIAIQRAIPLNDDLTPADSWVDDLKPDTDEYAQSYFRITLPPLGFDVYACASITQQMQINMRSGACIGCTFEIQVDWEDYKKNFYDSDGNFDPTIGQGHPRDAQKYPNSTSSSINVVVKKEISTFGTLMPNIYQQPKSGDLFVILGISLPQIYITNAQQRLDALAKQYMRENNTYYFDYPLKFDEYFLAKYPSILRQIRTNTIIRFDYAGQTLHLCVKQITIKFGEKQLPQYNITLTDNIDVVINPVTQVASDVSRISSIVAKSEKTNKGGGGGSGDAQDKLSKLIDDTANGIITFAKGIKIGLQQIFGWDADGNIMANNISADENISAGGRLNVGGNGSIGGDLHVSGVFDAIEAKINSLQSHNYSGSNLGDTGWKLTNNDGSGNSLLEVDKLLVRMKATFMELEIRKETFSGGNNHYSPAGSVIFKVDFLTEDNKALGYRNQKVPWLLKGLSFLFGNKSYTRQRHIRYAFTLDQLTPEEYAQVAKFRCYLISDDGTTATRNWWQVGDQPRCQSFNKAITREDKRAKPYDTSTPGTVDPATPLTSDFWWRLITEVGSKQLDDGKVYDFVDMPFEHYYKYQDEYAHHPENFCAAGSGYPKEGDTIVCMGNRVDPARMNLVSIISVATDYSNAPAIKAWRGIHTFSFDGCEVFGFSYEKVRVQSRSFEWITDDGTYLPNILERGAYESGVRYHWYDRVSHNGSMWLCLIADAKVWVDAAGEPIATPSTADIVTGEGVYVYDQQNNRKDRYYKLAVRNGATYGYYVQNWTSDEPTDTNNNWLKQVVRGTDGITITDCIVRYAASLSGVTPPNVESYWKTTIEATGVKPGQYLWTRSTTYYSDNRQPTVEYSVARWGIDGDGIASIDSFYWATTDVVAMTKAWDEAHLLPWNASASQEAKRSMWAPTYSDLETVWGAGNMQGMYVWEKTVIKYDMADNPDGTPVTKADAISYQCNRIGTDGLIGEEEYYFLASSNDFATVFGNPSQPASYLYAKTGIRWYTEDTPSTTDLPAAENYRLSSTTPNICTSASQQTTATTPIWSPTMPVYAGDEKKYLWNFEQRVDGSGTQYATKPICLGNHARGITGILELYALSASGTPRSGGHIPQDVYEANGNSETDYSHSDPEKPKTWVDEIYDRAPTEALPYQWNWTRTLYSDGGHEDHYHVSAVKGTRGEDGAGIEYVYYRPQTHDANGNPVQYTIPDVNNTKGQYSPGVDEQGNPKPADGSQNYDKTKDDWVPKSWTDNPVGIDFTHQIEYQCERKSTATTGTGGFTGGHEWGHFSQPKTWSKWGKNGMDGDGVEYVFVRTTTNSAPTITNSSDTYGGKTYLDDEYLPLSSVGRCTDDPQGTDSYWHYEWVAKRSKGTPNAETGVRVWEKYSGTMAEWSNYGENAIRLALDNEHEDFLYSDKQQQPIAPSSGATSPIHLYDGATEKTSGFTLKVYDDGTGSWVNQTSSSATSAASISDSTLIVSDIRANAVKVRVRAEYPTSSEKYYFAEFTANKTSQDKYDIVVAPSSVAYNSATFPNSQSIAITYNRMTLQGGQENNLTPSTSKATGNICVYYSFVNNNGTKVTPSLNLVSSLPFTLSKSNASSYAGVYFELRKLMDSTGSTYRLCDYETVEIAKSENGGDAVIYLIEPTVGSIKIPSDSQSAALSCGCAFYKREGSGQKTAFSTRYTVYTRSGSTFTMVSNGNDDGCNISTTVTTQMDAVVIYLFSSQYTGTSPESQAYLAKTEILVNKSGDDGKYKLSAYKASNTTPAKPSGTSVSASDLNSQGWYLNPSEASGTQVTLTYTPTGTWTRSGNTFTSPASTQDYGYYQTRISFTTRSDNIRIRLRLTASSEANCDFGYIGRLDTDLSSSVGNNYIVRASGTESVNCVLNIAEAGSHFFYIVYSKDRSMASGNDNAIVEILGAATIVDQIWESETWVDKDSGGTEQALGWSDPVEWNGLDGKDGADGFGYALLLIRNGSYTDSTWDTYGTLGTTSQFAKVDPEDFTVCRVGDLFMVSGTSSDSGSNHSATYLCTVVSSSSISGICQSYTKDGRTGDAGKTGRFYYYAGVYSAPPSNYKMQETQAPFVKDGNDFWMLDFKGEEPSRFPADATDAPSNSSRSWTKMASEQQYYIAKAFFGEYAQFGSFIINGDWMISTEGTVTLKRDYTVSTTYDSYSYGQMAFLTAKATGQHTITITAGNITGTVTVRLYSSSSSSYLQYVTLNASNPTKTMTANLTAGQGYILCAFKASSSVSATISLVSMVAPNGYLYFVGTDPTGQNAQHFAPNFAVDGMTGKSYQNDAYIKGEIHATSGSFVGTITADGSFIAKDSNSNGVVIINGGNNSSSSSDTGVTILDASGLYSRKTNDGFRLTSTFIQRYHTRKGWIPMFAARCVEVLGSPTETAQQYIDLDENHDFVLIQDIKNHVNVYLPKPDSVTQGKIYTIVAMGGHDRNVYVRMRGVPEEPSSSNQYWFQAGDARRGYLSMTNYEQANFVAYGNYWFATNAAW